SIRVEVQQRVCARSYGCLKCTIRIDFEQTRKAVYVQALACLSARSAALSLVYLFACLLLFISLSSLIRAGFRLPQTRSHCHWTIQWRHHTRRTCTAASMLAQVFLLRQSLSAISARLSQFRFLEVIGIRGKCKGLYNLQCQLK